MGDLATAINITETINKYNIQNFVETGTGSGYSMKQTINFKNLIRYGIELNIELCKKAESNFKNKVFMYQGYSHEQLPIVLKELSPQPTLFWLDAHFPDSDYFKKPYDSEKDPIKRIPLESELEIICNFRDYSNDVFVIDDLRIYEDLPNISNWSLRKKVGGKNINFIYNYLSKSHKITKILKDQGYLVCLPEMS